MARLKAVLAWLGSDWRLLIVVPLIVAAVFAISSSGFDAIRSSYEAHLRSQAAADTERALRRTDEIFRERERQRAPQLAGGIVRTAPGL